MTAEMEALIDRYWDKDEHDKIVKLIMDVPEEERDLDMLGQLVVAYNNLKYFDEAIALSMELKDRSKELPAWYYRIGYALNRKKEYQSAAEYLEEGVRLAYSQKDFDRAQNCFEEFYRCIPYLEGEKKTIHFQEEPLEVVWSEEESSFKVAKGVVNLGYMGTYVPHQMTLSFDDDELVDIMNGERDDAFYTLSEYIHKDMTREEQAKGISAFLNLRLSHIKEHMTEINQAFLAYLLLDDMVGCGYPIWEDCNNYMVWDKIPTLDNIYDAVYTDEFCKGTYPLVDKYYEKPMNGEVDNTTYVEDYLDKNLPMFDYRKMLQDVHSQYLYLGVNSIAVQCDGEGEAWNLVCCACVEIQKDNSFYDWHNH